jgi:hypothetical protein
MSTIITANRISNYMGYAPLPAKMGLGSLLVQNLPNSKEVCRNMVCSLLLRGACRLGACVSVGRAGCVMQAPALDTKSRSIAGASSHYRKTLGCCVTFGGGMGGAGGAELPDSVRGCVCDAGPRRHHELEIAGQTVTLQNIGMLSRLGAWAGGRAQEARCDVMSAPPFCQDSSRQRAGRNATKKKKCDKCFASCALRFSTVCFARTRLIKEAHVSSPLHRTNIHSVRDTLMLEAWG